MTSKRMMLSAATLALLLSTTSAYANNTNDDNSGFWGHLGIGASVRDDHDKADDRNMNHPSFDPGVFGTVTAVNSTTITLKAGNNGTVYTVDKTDATIKKPGTDNTAIDVGDTVFVQGDIDGTHIDAKSIIDAKFPSAITNRKDLSGTIGTVTAISGTTLTVKGKNDVTYKIDADDASIRTDTETDAEFSDIDVGDVVAIQGAVNGTSIDAATILAVDPDSIAKAKTEAETHAPNVGFFSRIGIFFKSLFGKH